MADISKIKLANGTTVTLKDAAGRADFATLLGTNTLTALGNAAWHAMAASISDGDGKIADAATVKAYVDAQIESIPTFDVVVVADGEDLPTASKDTFHKIYLKKEGISGTYAEYITVKIGEGYVWERIGTLDVDLAAYVKKTTKIAGIDLQDDITVAELQAALGLGNLAYANTATGSTTLETIDSITMKEVTVAGNAAVTHTSANAALTKGDYTPAGQVTGEAIKGGSISVTVKDAAAKTEASLTYGAYTPAGSVSLTKDNNGAFQVSGTVSKPDVTVDDSAVDTFVKSLKAGDVDAASFAEGEFTPASIDAAKFFSAGSLPTYAHSGFDGGKLEKGAAVTAATEGIVAAVGTGDDAETLIFSNAATDEVMDHDAAFTAATYGTDTFTQGALPSIDVVNGFSGGSKAADTFSANKLPVVDGTASAVTAVSAELAAAPEFTGDKFAPAFAGTEVAEMKVTKAEYLKQEIDAAEFTPVAATLGFSGTKAEQILVTGVAYDKADATATYSTKVTPETNVITKTAKTVEITVSPDAK